ncbi:MAG: cupin-like domain-containing protein [Alphaproteobacteria bacterium]|nr:cupin-like domain-containing protein [Alphaproteobacteria bacterium]MCB9792197.1 cupin-like domain-containing protein [Alphaproteobacteria bacterium]
MTPSLRVDRDFYRLAALDHLLWRGRPSQSPRFAAKEAQAQAARLRDGFTEARPAEALPELPATASREALLEATEGLRRPVVVRGFAAESVAARSWSEARLREALGEVRCLVFLQDASSRARSWDQGSELVELSFAEYLDRRLAEPLYLNNSTELFLARPELAEELPLQALRERFHTPGSAWDELVTHNLFVGAKHVYSSVHCAFGGNFFVEISGRKRWTFLDPAYGPHLHAIPGRPFQYLKSAYGGSRTQDEQGQASVISTLPRYEAVLEPGDLLYNPPWWWHEVDNLDDFTVGCALRHIPPPTWGSPSWQNHPVWSALSTYPKAQAGIWAHYLASKLSAGLPSVRSLYGERQVKALRQGLGRSG